MRTLTVDIETLPALRMSQAERRELARAKCPGSFKKIESIELWIDENEADVWARTALDSMLGQIWIIGWAIDDEAVRTIAGDDEGSLLRTFAEAVDEPCSTRWVAHNAAFDLVWLWRRAVLHGIEDLIREIPHEPYDRSAFCTMEAWKGIDRRGGYTKLDDLGRFLGAGAKTEGVTGADGLRYFQTGQWDAYAAYCAQDVELTRAVYRRLTTTGGCQP